METINEIIVGSDKKLEGFSMLTDIEDNTLATSSHTFNVLNSWRERGARQSYNPSKFRIVEVIEPFIKHKKSKKPLKKNVYFKCPSTKCINRLFSLEPKKKPISCPKPNPFKENSKENNQLKQTNTFLILHRERLKIYENNDHLQTKSDKNPSIRGQGLLPLSATPQKFKPSPKL